MVERDQARRGCGAIPADRFPGETVISWAEIVAGEHVLNQPGKDGFVDRREPKQTRVQTLQLYFRESVEIHAQPGSIWLG